MKEQMNQPNIVLDVRNIDISYGNVKAVQGVSLQLEAGQITSVIGPNGAGKTTLLSAIMGLLPSEGEVAYLGKSVAGLDVESRVEQGLRLVPERRELFSTMSVEDNLIMGAYTLYRQGFRDMRKSLEDVYQRFPRLKERRSQMAGTLSGGERAMLVLGRALMGQPKVLLLDEPSLGLAPLIVREIFSIVTDLKKSGVSILLVEQNARAALQASSYGYVLETGQVALEGPAEELSDNPAVMATYLGGHKKKQ
ncbi:ABC transporter ATP-binding protein [Limnohabitans sp. 15K]|jgi:branched-chain amino acid transport system ATP-binding protein|uniref:ABC transporter ATP-binding protein n=1 Tax=Limnohabitans sp. 15K TaxID=1100706 RepID=UPI000CCAD77C|nr:ABC transporter ATP-binding protein [Limnohabitans sp. 15K]PIT79682.1 ABC transporter ATP-binding protein [Limnohabitans sp. 15K]